MQQHLICLDIDGTLSTDTQGISNDTITIINDLQKKGHIIYVATGRMFLSAKKIANTISSSTGVIASNGGILSLPNKTITHTLDPQSTLEIYQLVTKKHLPIYFFCDNGVYYSETLPDFFAKERDQGRIDGGTQNTYHKIKNKEDLLTNAKKFINAIIISENDNDSLLIAKEKLMEYKNISVTSSYYNNIEITPKSISKATAIKELQDYYQIPITNTISFGDGLNDIEMFQVSNISVAMDNASKEVKACAKYSTLSNNDNGVYHFLKQYFRNEEK